MKHKFPIIFFALITVGILIFAGCNSDRTKIADVLNNPDRYMNRDITVAGVVDKTYSVNLVIAEAGAYQVNDGTGKIWVVTKNGVPAEGTKVGLKGSVSSGIKLGSESFGTVIREKDRRTR